MHRHTAIRILPLALALLLTAVGGAAARVFWKTVRPAFERLQQDGLRPLYSAEVVLNGGAGQFEIGLYPGSPAEAIRQLTGDGGSTPWMYRSGVQVASAAALLPGAFVRILALTSPDPDRSIICCLSQHPGEALRSGKPPSQPPRDLTLFPRHALTATWENHDTRTRAAIAETEADADTLREFYRDHYRRAGWMEMTGPSTAGLLVFSRAGEIALIQVSPRPESGRQSFSVLHKSLNIE